MPLDAVVLDTLTWNDMTASIRRRIPAASGSKWTLHAPVDPGITLLELFAYLIEQRTFWMDQIPDALVRAALALLGDAPRPAQPASTIFKLSSDTLTCVPANTRMQLRDQYPALIFTTDQETGLLRPGSRGIHVYAGASDLTLDLSQGKMPAIFPADCSAAELKLVLDIAGPLPAAPLSLLFELETPGDIAPQQSPDAVANVPPPAAISWMYPISSGQWKVIPNLEDGTGGFRRSGIVRFPAPSDWASDANGYTVSVRVPQASFASPVILAAPVIPNVVLARHRDPIDSGDTLSDPVWLPLPGQTLSLDDAPIENTVQLKIADASGAWQTWTPAEDFGPYGPADRVFVVERAAGLIRFGDGLTGRIPRADANHQIRYHAQYDSGGGTAGNVGSGLPWLAADTTVDLSAINVVAAEGGTEPETLQAALQRAAAELKETTRAVTAPDCEEIARTTPGVGLARAHASIGRHPALPCALVPGAITVYVVPFSQSAAPTPDPGALAAARARIEAARLIGSEIFVDGPRHRPVSLEVDLQGSPADPSAVRADIISRLQAFLHPLTGGDDGTGWPFGDAISPSALLREAQSAAGDGLQVITVSIGIDGAAPSENCIDVRIGPDDLVTLVDVTVKLSLGAPFAGGLR